MVAMYRSLVAFLEVSAPSTDVLRVAGPLAGFEMPEMIVPAMVLLLTSATAKK